MDVILTYDRERMDALGSVEVMALIRQHMEKQVPEFMKLQDYYFGKHLISSKERKAPQSVADAGITAPNAQPVCNHAKDIADTASGYFLGSPITYKLKGGQDDKKTKDAFDSLNDYFDYATVTDDDQENALTLSICGKCYEYIYASEDGAYLEEKPIDPQNAFIVYDQSIEHTELFGVYYYTKKDALAQSAAAQKASEKVYFIVMTKTELKYYAVNIDAANVPVAPYKIERHVLGQVPLIEYKNNRYCIGDFAQQIGLIDAYNTIMADRVNDIEQYIDKILVIYGALLGGDSESSHEAMEKLRKERLLELPSDGAKAEYLLGQLDEDGVEVLRKAIKEDIYTFSHVPNLTDENFVGNSSGVAMEYKLLGLEMLTKIKERWYRRGLRKRIAIFCNYLKIKGINLDPSDVEPTFSRGLPKNLLEISQIINNLEGHVSEKTLLGLLPFVENPSDEVEALEAEQKEEGQRQQQTFGTTNEAGSDNEPPEAGVANGDE